jgi:hypothetical protein
MNIDEAVEKDRRLERQAGQATLALMEHRYLCVKEFGLRQYAKAIDKNFKTVARYARAWQMWQDEGVSGVLTQRSPNDVLELAGLGQATREAADAVAEAKGIHVGQVRQSYPHEVRRVREAVADEPPETRPAKAQKVAQQMEKTRRAQEEYRTERRGRMTTTYLDLEREVDKARRALTVALTIARESQMDEECVTLLTDSIVQLKTLLGLIDLAVSGKIDVDWDMEMRKITEVK